MTGSRSAPGADAQHDVSRRAAAVRGVEGAGAPLPHLEAIQLSFGRHDLSGVRTRSGSRAAGRLGAAAYASGERIAFGPRPDLFLAAHEAAHVVQQRRGANPAPGESGPLEQHADAVAEKVTRGESAQSLLDAVPVRRGGASAGPAVQSMLTPLLRAAWRRIPKERIKEIAKRLLRWGTAEVLTEAALKQIEKELHELTKDLPAVEEIQALIKDVRSKLDAASLVENPAKAAATRGLQGALHALGDLVMEQGSEAWEEGRKVVESAVARTAVEVGAKAVKSKAMDWALGEHRETVEKAAQVTSRIDVDRLKRGAAVADKARQATALKKGKVRKAKKETFTKMAEKVGEVKEKVGEAEGALGETSQAESSLRTATISAVAAGGIAATTEALQHHETWKEKGKETGKAFVSAAAGDVASTLTSKLLVLAGVSEDYANVIGMLPGTVVEYLVRRSLREKPKAPAPTTTETTEAAPHEDKGKERVPEAPSRPAHGSAAVARMLVPPASGVPPYMVTPLGTMHLLQRYPWRPLSSSVFAQAARAISVPGAGGGPPPSPVQVMVLLGRRRPGQLYIMNDEDWDAYDAFVRRNPWARHPDFPPG